MSKTVMTTMIAAFLAWPGGASGQIGPEAARGALVWANNCTRCHNARPSAERTDVQWMVIVSHMRARANLTKTQARNVTAFLQATNLPPVVEVAPEAAAPAPTGAGEASGPVAAPTRTGDAAESVGGNASGRLDPATLQRLRAYLIRLAAATAGPPSR